MPSLVEQLIAGRCWPLFAVPLPASLVFAMMKLVPASAQPGLALLVRKLVVAARKLAATVRKLVVAARKLAATARKLVVAEHKPVDCKSVPNTQAAHSSPPHNLRPGRH